MQSLSVSRRPSQRVWDLSTCLDCHLRLLRQKSIKTRQASTSSTATVAKFPSNRRAHRYLAGSSTGLTLSRPSDAAVRPSRSVSAEHRTQDVHTSSTVSTSTHYSSLSHLIVSSAPQLSAGIVISDFLGLNFEESARIAGATMLHNKTPLQRTAYVRSYGAGSHHQSKALSHLSPKQNED